MLRAALVMVVVMALAPGLGPGPGTFFAKGEEAGGGGGGGGGGSYRSEMRSALSTLAAIIRAVADKLERHEVRERQLGEQLWRGQQALDKRLRASDAALSNVSLALARQDSRLARLQDTLVQGQEAAKEQLRECQLAAAEAANSALATQRPPQAQAEAEAQAAATAQRLERATIALDKASRAASSALADAEARLRGVAASSDALLDKYESRLEALNAAPAPAAPAASAVAAPAEMDWHTLFLSALEAQGGTLRELSARAGAAATSLTALEGRWRQQTAEAANDTLRAVEAARAHLAADADKAAESLQRSLQDARAEGRRSQEEILQALSDQAEQADRTADRLHNAYDEIHKQVLALRSSENVLVQTADNVMDTKRGVEYGVHQILLQTGTAVKEQAEALNATLSRRFDAISTTILTHQTGALTNLSSKIEEEISQVWRQIGNLYQQLTVSTSTLDRLQQQTDSYVNGSATAMDNMEGKVGAIRERMNEVEENLNYLLGKLSLFSSEFGQVRTGLGEALDSIRSTFLEAQEAIRAAGPGPNPIPGAADPLGGAPPDDIPPE